MKIRSLLLGSVAAAGLSTGAFAADLGVLPSFDICDDLGLSGLTISSEDNCLVITGGVEYTFTWGDYTNGSARRRRLLLHRLRDRCGRWRRRERLGRASSTPGCSSRPTSNTDFGKAKAVIKITNDD